MLDEVRWLTAGYCVGVEAMARRGAPWRWRRFPAGFGLFQHREHGLALFDTGLTTRFNSETRRYPNRLYAHVAPMTIGMSDSARCQLMAMGIKPGDIRHVVVSHFHADHIAGLRDFPAATIVCSRAAWLSVRDSRGLSALARGFLRGLLPPDVEQRLLFVDDLPEGASPRPLVAFGPARDLFGDGSVRVLHLPGHAVGQIGLFLTDSTVRSWFLIGDAAWLRKAIATCVPPPALTTAMLGDTRAYRSTLAGLAAVHRAWPALEIIPAHDLPGRGQW
jgi:glyoxylase-like metal-dependent hydrolase (beta-lactamase superfamily II)